MQTIYDMTSATMETLPLTLQSHSVVLLKFGARWCKPCQLMLPVLHELANHYGTHLHVATVDVDTEPELCERYGVDSVPCMLLLHKGAEQQRWTGVTDKADLSEAIDRACLHVSMADVDF